MMNTYLFYLQKLLVVFQFLCAFASLVCVPVGITSPAIGLKTCAITAIIKKYNPKYKKSIINKKKKKDDKIVLLGETKLDTIEVLISKALINSYNSHDKFVSVNNENVMRIK